MTQAQIPTTDELRAALERIDTRLLELADRLEETAIACAEEARARGLAELATEADEARRQAVNVKAAIAGCKVETGP